MKRLHRPDLFGWSRFDEARDIDFHSVLWVRPAGNVAFDPLPLSEHDRGHLRQLGPLAWIFLTNSDHARGAERLRQETGARVAAPRGERESFPVPVDDWLGEGPTPVPGLDAVELHGSKTPGELAFVLDHTTLVTGDLVRAHEAGRLCCLPEAKLIDPAAARDSLRRLAALDDVDAVLVGDGWPVFRGGHRALQAALIRS